MILMLFINKQSFDVEIQQPPEVYMYFALSEARLFIIKDPDGFMIEIFEQLSAFNHPI